MSRDWANAPVIREWVAARKVDGKPLREAVRKELEPLYAAITRRNTMTTQPSASAVTISDERIALLKAQAAIAKCLSEGGIVLKQDGTAADWWDDIIAAQQSIAAALRSDQMGGQAAERMANLDRHIEASTSPQKLAGAMIVAWRYKDETSGIWHYVEGYEPVRRENRQALTLAVLDDMEASLSRGEPL